MGCPRIFRVAIIKPNPTLNPVAKSAKPAKTWKCPKCGREFARRSAYHGCGQYTLEGHLAGKRPEAVALFNELLACAERSGPIMVSPVKTQITFRVRTTFLMVALSGKQLVGYLFLNREAPGPFFKKISAASAQRFVHHFRIADAQVIRGPFAKLLNEAIATQTENETEAESESDEKKERQMSIGEEINALYRTQRTLSRLSDR
jgi:hypothetical protein